MTTNGHTGPNPGGDARVVSTAGTRPILRAPPFRGARPRGRPVRVDSPQETLSPEALAALIAAARVGGSFWGVRPQRSFRTLLRLRSLRDARGAVDATGGKAQDILVSLSDRARRLAASPVLPGVETLYGDADPWALIEQAELIVAGPDDEIALLACAHGRTVLDPGTRQPLDRASILARLAERIAAYRYGDPYSGRPIDAAHWITILGDWRRQVDTNRRIAVAVGIAKWKREAVASLLWSPERVTLSRSIDPACVSEDKAIAIWPSRSPRDLPARAAQAGRPIARIEDGFIRSIGLGAHLHPPRSIVVDMDGIHFDPGGPSGLERLLNETDFEEALIRRAADLLHMITRYGITKYGAGLLDPLKLPDRPRRVLVPGQVEDDLSVRLGGAGIRSNLELLRRAREAEPDAWIAYKPHPDVVAGLRKGHVLHNDALAHADIVLPDGDMANILSQVDAVHVLTSLTGFEALTRGCEVVTHGQPFYAGWGLTTDMAPPIARRQRRLTIEQLAAGALILYPRYLDPVTNLPCPPEVLVWRYATLFGKARPGLLSRLRMVQGRMAVAGRALGALRA
ncbi:beta-3-deoxy-D-manno-oct-2-ulosonic acid transferase [Sphingomonas sp. H39-1-10]|uniref:capsular polysaccharide export protein, LipB/KpsS family n=1 Tax=Sphingomonas pollutisoli TaxID=3030829 RepID=UPI0023B9F5E5|nr:beta-3-deoxy-D-manno-oct-2-ulosonic acid transferase [Sphingomonas pollutisoli]MDF0490481.1 beta-3-deoxy-D-manno-oct-2-ulosonic acid transferase [Sphingomonas pollutisoli]